MLEISTLFIVCQSDPPSGGDVQSGVNFLFSKNFTLLLLCQRSHDPLPKCRGLTFTACECTTTIAVVGSVNRYVISFMVYHFENYLSVLIGNSCTRHSVLDVGVLKIKQCSNYELKLAMFTDMTIQRYGNNNIVDTADFLKKKSKTLCSDVIY